MGNARARLACISVPSFATRSQDLGARVRDRRKERRRKKTFPSEYSFAICLISLAFSNTGPRSEGDDEKPLVFFSTFSSFHRIYLPNFRIYIYAIRHSQRFRPLRRSLLFLFFIFFFTRK